MLLFHPLDVIDVTLDHLSSRQVRIRRVVENSSTWRRSQGFCIAMRPIMTPRSHDDDASDYLSNREEHYDSRCKRSRMSVKELTPPLMVKSMEG